jgi:cell division protease FtsH
VELLTEHRSVLDALTDLLLENETVDGSEVYRLAGLPDRSALPPSVATPATVAPHAVATADASHQDSAVN